MSTPIRYQGRCHCGAIQFEFTADRINKDLRCNCSLCVRKGATMTAFTVTPEDMQLNAEPNAIATYRFGEATATHYFCTVCGIYPFHSPASAPEHYRINIGCLLGVDAASLPFDVYNGSAL